MAFAWMPFAVAAQACADEPQALRWLVAATLLFSFAHQPMTLWLAYGDAEQRRSHRTLFVFAPVALGAVICVASSLQPAALALVAGAWNLAHTIRQRYGISRLYGRLSGIDCTGDNRLLWSWLLVAVLVATAGSDLSEASRHVGLGERNATALQAVASLREVAVVALAPALVVALVLTSESLREGRRRRSGSLARRWYLGSTASLLAVLALEPITGFVAYVGGHAAEYLFMARWRVARAAEGDSTRDPVGALARRIGCDGTLAVYAVGVVALVAAMRASDGHRAVLVLALTVGALHFVYDGVIWRSPRPAAHPDVG
jgi:hypothetical protein